MTTIARIALGYFVLAALNARVGRAQNAEAEALFSDGTRLMDEGKLVEACQSFEASNELEPRAGTLIQLGVCRERNHQLASAWSAYKDALSRVKDPRKRQLADARARDLESRLSYLTITIAPAAQVEGLTITRNGRPFGAKLWNRPLPMDGGEYVISAHVPGHDTWRTTTAVPVEGGLVVVEVPKLAELPVPVEPVPPHPVTATALPGPTPRERPATSARRLLTPKRGVAIAAVGVAVVAAGIGIGLGVEAKQRRDQAYALCSDSAQPCANANAANALIAQSHGRALGANVAFGLAGVAVAAGGVLWLTGAPRERGAVALAPVIGETNAIVVVGRF